MHKSKLLRIIYTLNETEILAFTKFVVSPYFNENKILSKLWDLILGNIASEETTLTKEYFFNNLFPDKKYDDTAMRKLMTELTQLLEKFLVIQNKQQDEWLYKKTLLNCFGEKNLKKEFKQAMDSLNKNISLAPMYGYDPSLELFNINRIFYAHTSTDKLQNEEEHLTQVVEHLDDFFISSKLHFATEQINRQKIFSKDYSISFLKEVKSYLKRQDKKSNLVQLYLLLLHLLEKGYSAKRFSTIELLFKKSFHLLTPEKKHAILIFMINIVTKAINHGQTQLSQKNLELYQMGIQEKILIQNNRITHETFTNIIIFSANLLELDYSKNFIANYSSYLDKSIREEAISFCTAVINFYDKKFDEVIAQLTQYNFDKGLFDVRAKSILTRALVEQYLLDHDNYDFFITSTKTTDRYLRRKENLAKDKINGYLMLLSYSVSIVKLIQSRNATPQNWEKLTKKIQNEKLLFARKWLLSTIQACKIKKGSS